MHSETDELKKLSSAEELLAHLKNARKAALEFLTELEVGEQVIYAPSSNSGSTLLEVLKDYDESTGALTIGFPSGFFSHTVSVNDLITSGVKLGRNDE